MIRTLTDALRRMPVWALAVILATSLAAMVEPVDRFTMPVPTATLDQLRELERTERARLITP